MNNSIINSVLMLVIVVVLVALAFRVRCSAPPDSIAILKTSGMTCAGCSDTIVRALTTVPGVAAAEVDVPGGRVSVGYAAASVTPETLVRQVTASGFGSTLQGIVTPRQFKQLTGRDFGRKGASSGCCSGAGRCAGDRKI
jgi:periplasmic mercuric ion binding protein